jgi:hypothetical protein
MTTPNAQMAKDWACSFFPLPLNFHPNGKRILWVEKIRPVLWDSAILNVVP